MLSPEDRPRLCLASCFLTLTAEHTRWWLRIQDALAARGVDFVLLTSNPPTDPRLHTIEVPLFLHEFAGLPGAAGGGPTLEPELAEALVRRDRNWVQEVEAGPRDDPSGLEACQGHLRSLLAELQPALVLVWGSSLGQSVLLQQLSLQQGRRCWVIERGLFGDTLMIELAGQGGQSELSQSFTVRNAWRNATDTGAFAAAREYYGARRSTKYAQAEFEAPEALRRRLVPPNRKLVALLLQHDASSCLAPVEYAGARLHAPVIANAAEAIAHLSAAVAALDCMVVAKPHPTDHRDYAGCGDERVRLCRDVNLHSLIAAADVVATMTSTTQFEALLFEKPLLLLAATPLSNKGIAYEPRTTGDLTACLGQALRREGFAERQANARRFVSFVLQNHSIGLVDGTPAGSTIAEFCDFLAEHAWPAPGPDSGPSTEEVLRQARELQDAEHWKEAGKLFQILCGRRPHDLEIWRNCIVCARRQGHDAVANAVASQAITLHPEWAAQVEASFVAESVLSAAHSLVAPNLPRS